jgi:hypothetical protein|nr:MAG TPA: hypothetical protein [Caudoviricetes sp.]
MMTTTTYGFRAEEERMQASDEYSDARARREILAWNALQAIKQSTLRETAYDALEPEINDGDIAPGWFQVGHYIVGVADRDGLTVSVHELTACEQGLVGLEGLTQAPGDLGAQGGFSWSEKIGNAQCRAKFVGDKLSVSITRL